MEPTRAGPSPLNDQIRLDPFYELARRRGWLHTAGRMAGDWHTTAMAEDLAQFTLSGGMAHPTVNRIIRGQQKVSPAFALAVQLAAQDTYGAASTPPLTDYFQMPRQETPDGTSARTEGPEDTEADGHAPDTAGRGRPA